MKSAKVASALLIAGFWCGAAGCSHSHVIKVNIVNSSGERLSSIEVDYPDATFGIASLDPGKTFQYTIKPTGTGPLKLQFVNSQHAHHVYSGPTVHPGDDGSLEIRLTQEAATSEIHVNRAE
jgi:hypothetical protein